MCVGLACLVGEFLENSRLSLREAQLLDLATSPAAAETGEGGMVVESLGWESGQAVSGGRREAESPGTAARSQRGGLFPWRGCGRQPPVQEGLASETSCDRRAESILASGGLEESP